jgi:hypothetical protein
MLLFLAVAMRALRVATLRAGGSGNGGNVMRRNRSASSGLLIPGGAVALLACSCGCSAPIGGGKGHIKGLAVGDGRVERQGIVLNVDGESGSRAGLHEALLVSSLEQTMGKQVSNDVDAAFDAGKGAESPNWELLDDVGGLIVGESGSAGCILIISIGVELGASVFTWLPGRSLGEVGGGADVGAAGRAEAGVADSLQHAGDVQEVRAARHPDDTIAQVHGLEADVALGSVVLFSLAGIFSLFLEGALAEIALNACLLRFRRPAIESTLL